jgi:hypothetical protein
VCGIAPRVCMSVPMRSCTERPPKRRERWRSQKKKGRGVGRRREDRLACVCARMKRQSLKARQGKLLHVRVQLPPPINHLERDRERESKSVCACE